MISRTVRALSAGFVAISLALAPSVAAAATTPHNHETAVHRRHAAPKHKPVNPLAILRSSATPYELAPSGGRTVVSADLRDATSCWVAAVGSPYPVSVSKAKPKQCTSGRYEQAVYFGPNKTRSPVIVTLRLSVAGRNGKIVTAPFHVLVRAAPPRSLLPVGAKPKPVTAGPPAVLRARATPGQLNAAGGTAMVIGEVRGATTCHLAVLADHGVQVTLPRQVPCHVGMYGQLIRLGPNHAKTAAVLKLALIATGVKGASAQGVFYVVLTGTSAPLPPGALPPGVSVKVLATKSLPKGTHATGPVSETAVVVHATAGAPSDQTVRLAFSDAVGAIVATAAIPRGCGQFLIEFSKPIPRTTVLLIGAQRHFGKGPWMPEGPPVFFNFTSSAVFTVNYVKGIQALSIAPGGSATC